MYTRPLFTSYFSALENSVDNLIIILTTHEK